MYNPEIFLPALYISNSGDVINLHQSHDLVVNCEGVVKNYKTGFIYNSRLDDYTTTKSGKKVGYEYPRIRLWSGDSNKSKRKTFKTHRIVLSSFNTVIAAGLDADHIKPIKDYPELATSLDNLQWATKAFNMSRRDYMK
jgi:hypothetical protein